MSVLGSMHTQCRKAIMSPSMSLLTTAVAVFTNNVGMAASCRRSKAFADEVAEARGVEHRATANDLVLGQTTQLPCKVRQDVH